MIPDQHVRQFALNTERSFIVQAPAGSGKTELLVQRFLALLARAEHAPEEIIAITFTRKAAAEMRQRILKALNAAQNTAPDEPHAYQTWQLACAALQRNQQCQWHLLENPNRLRVLTIDALCASIARQAPLLSGLGITHHLLEQNISQYYLEAARRLLSILEEESSLSTQLAVLLMHLDNRVEILERLFVRILMHRDQWLPHLITHGKRLNAPAFKQMLEKSLYDVVAEILWHCDSAIPAEHRDELLALLRFSVASMQKENLPMTVMVEDFETFPTPQPEKKSAWLFLAEILLTQKGTWRVRVDKSQGFFPAEKAMKQRMHMLLQQLSRNELLRGHLIALLNAPPIIYTESQWYVIAALCELLPLLVAELKVLFKEKSAADFSEIALSASSALGDKEFPTDLSFILDTKIRHLLVDEFQDTSITQFHLLEKLTIGWQSGDGRSLFLVGDPMQSIYRFREAEVGLFLKAQQEGLGSIMLEPLVLQANFRATPELVTWINTQFSAIFPKQSDMHKGAIAFTPCVATQACDKNSGAFLHIFLKEEKSLSIKKLIEVVAHTQSLHPENTIAILVRSRTHLREIIPMLKKANLAFNAVEIDALYRQSIIQDLLALTGALFHLGDRLSWFAVLRSPWCGLTLHDLHVIAGEDFKQPLWETLCMFEEISTLSVDGRQRLNHIVPIFRQALGERGRLSNRIWIEKTWIALNGPACIKDAAELSSVEAYLKLLDSLDQSEEILNITTLQQAVKMQYASSLSAKNSRLHIMTIHKAKGLEFDTVIIPHLELKNKNDHDQLLLWLDRARMGRENDLILAPIKGRHQKCDPIYDWIRGIEKEKSQHELVRLLYVAATRAKRNLHLLAVLPVEEKGSDLKKPDIRSFLGLLWGCFSEVAKKIDVDKFSLVVESAEQSESAPMMLRRLKIDSYKIPVKQLSQSISHVHLQSLDQTTGHIGTVIHRVLEQISREGLASWTSQRITQEQLNWKMLLFQAGVSQVMLNKAMNKISTAIHHTLNDPRGYWILKNHAEHRSEYALTTILNGSPVHFVIDRTFVDEQHIRWIIDYKTSVLEDTQNINVFLAKAQLAHCAQLEKYASIMRVLDNKFIRLGIYFPVFGGWCEWDSIHNDSLSCHPERSEGSQ